MSALSMGLTTHSEKKALLCIQKGKKEKERLSIIFLSINIGIMGARPLQ